MNELKPNKNTTERMNWTFPIWNNYIESILLAFFRSTYSCRHHHTIRLIGLMALFSSSVIKI